MPDPKKYKKKSEFMSTCISTAKSEGKDQDQAAAMCNSMWENKDSYGDKAPKKNIKDKFTVFSQNNKNIK